MKNKGRIHLASNANLKGYGTYTIRPVNKMGTHPPHPDNKKWKKFQKKYTANRVRQYFKNFDHTTDIDFDSNY